MPPMGAPRIHSSRGPQKMSVGFPLARDDKKGCWLLVFFHRPPQETAYTKDTDNDRRLEQAVLTERPRDVYREEQRGTATQRSAWLCTDALRPVCSRCYPVPSPSREPKLCLVCFPAAELVMNGLRETPPPGPYFPFHRDETYPRTLCVNFKRLEVSLWVGLAREMVGGCGCWLLSAQKKTLSRLESNRVHTGGDGCSSPSS